MSADVASTVIAKYALTPAAELERTLPLEPGDNLLVGVTASTYYTGAAVGVRRSFVRVSTERLCIVRRYGFIRDRILVIPPRAIRSVEGNGHSEPVQINFCAQGGQQTITVISWLPRKTTTINLDCSTAVAEPLRMIASMFHSGSSEA